MGSRAKKNNKDIENLAKNIRDYIYNIYIGNKDIYPNRSILVLTEQGKQVLEAVEKIGKEKLENFEILNLNYDIPLTSSYMFSDICKRLIKDYEGKFVKGSEYTDIITDYLKKSKKKCLIMADLDNLQEKWHEYFCIEYQLDNTDKMIERWEDFLNNKYRNARKGKKKRIKTEEQLFKTALEEYIRSKDVNLSGMLKLIPKKEDIISFIKNNITRDDCYKQESKIRRYIYENKDILFLIVSERSSAEFIFKYDAPFFNFFGSTVNF